MPENSTLAMMFTWPSPPLIWPTSALAKSKMRSVTPERFINCAVRMKKGTASSGKLLRPAIMRWPAKFRPVPCQSM